MPRSRPGRWLVVLALAGVLGAGSGCAFHRTVVNGKYRNLDTSWIEPGQTTYLEVLKRLGPPADVASPTEMLEARYSTRALKYTTYDAKSVQFDFLYYLVLKYLWEDKQDVYQLLVEFDDDQRVRHVYEGTKGTIWRPFQKGVSRRPPTLKKIK